MIIQVWVAGKQKNSLHLQEVAPTICLHFILLLSFDPKPKGPDINAFIPTPKALNKDNLIFKKLYLDTYMCV